MVRERSISILKDDKININEIKTMEKERINELDEIQGLCDTIGNVNKELVEN